MSTRHWLVRFAFAFSFVICFGTAAQAQQCGPMDVVFVVDNTGSMAEVISVVQEQVNAIADTVTASSGGDYQFGLVAAPSNDVAVLLDLASNNRAALDEAVDKMSTQGSCSEPALWGEGLNAVLNNLQEGSSRSGTVGKQVGSFSGSFRADATKIIIVITDARPGGFNDCDFLPGVDDALVHNLAVAASARNIRVATVFVPTSSAEAFGQIPAIRAILQDMAITSDSVFLQTQPDASDLATIIQQVIESCGGGRGSLLIEPKELFVTNNETVEAVVTNFRPPRTGVATYEASGLPEDSKVTFTTRPATITGTDVRTMKVTIGPDTVAGTYILNVNSISPQGGRQFNYVLVHVDCRPPFIFGTPANQPQSQSVARGATAQLSVVPNGSGPYRYQWYIGPTGSTAFPIAGATGATLTTPPIDVATEFWVRVSNACGSRDSATAVVTPQ